MKILQGIVKFVRDVFWYVGLLLVVSVYLIALTAARVLEPAVQYMRPGLVWHKFSAAQDSPVLRVTVTAHGLGSEMTNLRLQDFCNQASQEVFDRVVGCCLTSTQATPPVPPAPSTPTVP